jgi:rfaE bifunctional protein kinase chain/domain
MNDHKSKIHKAQARIAQTKIIDKFFGKRVIVLGDILVDKYIIGDATRISPEAPVPVVHVKNERYIPGGASNVANNLASLGARVYLCGVIGDDIVGRRFLDDLNGVNINTDWIEIDKTRSTIVKTRVLASHQQLIRFDYEQIQPISKEIEDRITDRIRRNIHDFEAVVLSDYEKGFITSSLVEKIISISHRAGKIVVAGPKPRNIEFYSSCDAISLNRSESMRCIDYLDMKKMKMRTSQEIEVEEIGSFILKKLKPKALLITLSEKGMLLVEPKKRIHIPACAKEVFDVTGAGDTVLAAFSLAIAAGADFESAARLANKAAGIVVGKLGTATVSSDELKNT